LPPAHIRQQRATDTTDAAARAARAEVRHAVDAVKAANAQLDASLAEVDSPTAA
jgi:hypothetical protein